MGMFDNLDEQQAPVAATELAQPSAPVPQKKPSNLFDDILPQQQPEEEEPTLSQAPKGIPDQLLSRPKTSGLFDDIKTEQKVTPKYSQTGAFARSAGDAALFNFRDELTGLFSTNPVAYFAGDPEAIREYERVARETREASEESAKEYPKTAFAGAVAGSLPWAAIPFGGAARGAKLGTQALQSLKAGAIYGGLSGAGSGEGLESRLTQAGIGAGVGAGIGAVAPVIPSAVSFAFDRTLKPMSNIAKGWRNPEAVTASRVAAALLADQADIVAGKARGMTLVDWQAAKAAGEPVVLTDLGAGRTQALLRSAINSSPEGMAGVKKILDERFNTQAERIGTEIRHLVSGGANAVRTKDQLKEAYNRSRIPAYRAAFQDPKAQSIWDEDLALIAQSPSGQEAIKKAFITAKDEAAKLGFPNPKNPFYLNPETGRVSLTQNMSPNLQFWDAVKKNLDEGPKESQGWAKILRNKLDTIVPTYKNARSVAADFFDARDAVEAGQKLAKSKMDPEEIKKFFKALDPSERELVREGFASDLATKVIDEMRLNGDMSKAILNSVGSRKRFETVFGKTGADKVEARLAFESIMDSARKALGNSTTAKQLIEAGLAGGGTGMMLGDYDLASFMTGAAGAAGARRFAASELARGARTAVGYVDRGVATRVADLLVSDDFTKIQKGIDLAVKNKKVMDGLKALANGLSMATLRASTEPRSAPLVGSQTEEYPTEEGSVFEKMQRARGGKVERPFARAEGGYLPSEDYLAAMRKSESFKPKAYWDVKQYSIGYGTKANSPDEKISQEEALRRFYQEVTPAAAMVNRFAPDAPEGVKAALTSLTYNTGSKWMESGLGKAIKDSDYDKARQIFLKYTKADGKELEGLKRRRESEAKWFGSPAISAGGVSPEAYEALDTTYREQTEQPKTDQDKLDALIAEIVRTPEVQPMAPMAPIQAPPRATVPTVMPYSRADGGRAEVRSFEPTISDRIAQYLLGEEKVSPEYRRVVEGLTGSSGLGRTGIGIIDVTPAGIPTAVQEGKRAAEEGRYGEAALTAASLMPLPALQTAGQAAKTATKSLDPLGYFSGALEAAKALSQNKGTPEQMLTMLEKSKGVKRAEIEATGLDKFLADKKSVTKDDIVQFLGQNRIALQESGYGETPQFRAYSNKLDEIREKIGAVQKEIAARVGHHGGPELTNDPRYKALVEEMDQLRAQKPKYESPRYSSFSLDPYNPTYRETVLNLPRPTEEIQRQMDALTADVEAKGIQPGTPEWDAYEKKFYDLSDKKHSLPRRSDFKSEHFPEPNIVGHMMTSTVKYQGQPTFLVDQIQSDWGQKIRKSGARDDAKISELKQKLNTGIKMAAELHKKIWDNDTDDDLGRELSRQYADLQTKNRNIDAEIRKAEAITASNPLVNTTDQWVNTTLRKALMQAADEDAKYIAIPSGDTVLSYNPGDTKGMREFYGAAAEGKRTEGIVPKNLRNILRGLDKNAPKPFVVDTLEAPEKGQTGQGFTLFPLTPELKQKIKEGLPLFTAAGALPFVAPQEQEKTKAHGGSVTAKMWRNKMRRTH